MMDMGGGGGGDEPRSSLALRSRVPKAPPRVGAVLAGAGAAWTLMEVVWRVLGGFGSLRLTCLASFNAFGAANSGGGRGRGNRGQAGGFSLGEMAFLLFVFLQFVLEHIHVPTMYAGNIMDMSDDGGRGGTIGCCSQPVLPHCVPHRKIGCRCRPVLSASHRARSWTRLCPTTSRRLCPAASWRFLSG
jgi:hypothetical protein